MNLWPERTYSKFRLAVLGELSVGRQRSSGCCRDWKWDPWSWTSVQSQGIGGLCNDWWRRARLENHSHQGGWPNGTSLAGHWWCWEVIPLICRNRIYTGDGRAPFTHVLPDCNSPYWKLTKGFSWSTMLSFDQSRHTMLHTEVKASRNCWDH